MPEYVELNHDGIVKETEKAVLIDFGDEQEWIPRSQMEALEANTVEVAEWLAIEKGLV